MSLAAYWKCNDDAASTAVVDAGPSGLDGVASANTNTLQTSGPAGYAFQFDGATTLVTVADPAGGEIDFGIADDFTINFWIKLTPDVGGDFYLSKNDGSNGYAIVFVSGGGGICRFSFRTHSGGVLARVQTDDIYRLGDGNWHMTTAVRYANAKDELEIWVDGIFTYSSDDDLAPGPNRDLTNATDLTFGGDVAPHRISDMTIYDHALSGGEIHGIYAAYNQPYQRRGFR